MEMEKKSVPRKIVDASWVWEKPSGNYGALDFISRIDSTVLFTLAYGLHKLNYEDLSIADLKKYLKIRKLPDTEGKDLVREQDSCYENTEAMIYVRALTKKRWNENKYNQVVINNLASNDDSDKRKVESFKNLKASCGCTRSGYQSICRPSSYQMRMFRDERKLKDIPGSFIDTIICKHANIAFDWSHIFYNSTDFFGFFGMSRNVVEVSKRVIKDVLEYNIRLPDFQLNQLYRNEARKIYEPLIKIVWYA